MIRMIRRTTIVGTVALALVATLGCDRNARRDDNSTTNTTGASRDLDNNGVNDTRLDDKGVVRNEVRDETLFAKDAGHVFNNNGAAYGTNNNGLANGANNNNSGATGANAGTTGRLDPNVAEARREAADDRADLMTKRADYKAHVTEDLADTDKRIAKLEEKLATEKDATVRARIQHGLPAIKVKRDAFKRSIDGVDGATASSWDTTKVGVNRVWGELKAAVDDASR